MAVALIIVKMTVANDGAIAYFVSDVIENEEVSALNGNNSAWQLTIGTRYEISVTGASSHPFALRDSSNDILLSKNSVAGSFESDSAVNFTTDGSSFNFTHTQKLVDQLDNYVCTIRLGMNGGVTNN